MWLGWACGAHKHTAVYIPAQREADLMIKMADLVITDFGHVVKWLKDIALENII